MNMPKTEREQSVNRGVKYECSVNEAGQPRLSWLQFAALDAAAKLRQQHQN